MFQEFKIMRGVMPLPDYTDNPENDRIVFDLQSGGFGLADGEQYSPRHTQTKNGGVWSDSALSNGRNPLSLPYGNVIESVNFKVSKTSFKELNTTLNSLGRFISECKRFGTSHSFIDPVYIAFAQDNTVPSQYALLLDLNFELTYQGKEPDIENTYIALVTISWEREYGWRSTPPGTTPVYHSQLSRGLIPGTDFDYADLNPLSSDSLVYEANYTNRLEYDFGAGKDSPTITENYITIPKEDIPGDLPALCMIDIGDNSTGFSGGKPVMKRMIIGHSITPRLPVPDSFSNDFNDNFVFAAADANRNIGFFTPTYQANTGVLSNASTVTRYSLDMAFAAGALSENNVLNWGFGAGGNLSNVDYQVRSNSLRGKYQVFIRQNLTSGTSTDMEFYLRFTSELDFGSFVDTNTFNPTSVTGGGNTDWAMLYLGNVSLPVGNRVNTQLHDGEGLLNVDDNTIVITLRHNAKASGTGALTLRVCDIILIPYDVASCIVEIPNTTGGSVRQLTIDNTAYLTHGQNRQQARFTRVSSPESLATITPEIKGTTPKLIPGVDNHLHFMMTTLNGSLEEVSQTEVESDDVQIGVNIVPRWAGVRDE